MTRTDDQLMSNNSNTETQSPRTGISPERAPVSDEQLAREIASVSPEGRPTRPRVGYRTTALFIAAIFAIAVGVTVLVGVLVSPWLALAIVVVAGLSAAIFNPAIWASAVRANENESSARRAVRGADHES